MGHRRASAKVRKIYIFLNLMVVIRVFALEQFFGVSFEIRRCQSFNFVLLFQDGFGCFGSLAFSYKF